MKEAPKSSKRVALVRYRSEDWERWRRSVDDPEVFQGPFEEWWEKAEAMARRLEQARLEVVWIEVDPDRMTEWCRARGCRNVNERRMQFAAEQIGNVRIH